MTQEEYNRLDTDFAHCAGTHCGKASECLRHTAYKMLAGNGNETYTMVNPAVIKGAQPCPLFDPDHKERYAWGISSIYDNVRAADLRCSVLNKLTLSQSKRSKNLCLITMNQRKYCYYISM